MITWSWLSESPTWWALAGRAVWAVVSLTDRGRCWLKRSVIQQRSCRLSPYEEREIEKTSVDWECLNLKSYWIWLHGLKMFINLRVFYRTPGICCPFLSQEKYKKSLPLWKKTSTWEPIRSSWWATARPRRRTGCCTWRRRSRWRWASWTPPPRAWPGPGWPPRSRWRPERRCPGRRGGRAAGWRGSRRRSPNLAWHQGSFSDCATKIVSWQNVGIPYRDYYRQNVGTHKGGMADRIQKLQAW